MMIIYLNKSNVNIGSDLVFFSNMYCTGARKLSIKENLSTLYSASIYLCTKNMLALYFYSVIHHYAILESISFKSLKVTAMFLEFKCTQTNASTH